MSKNEIVAVILTAPGFIPAVKVVVEIPEPSVVELVGITEPHVVELRLQLIVALGTGPPVALFANTVIVD